MTIPTTPITISPMPAAACSAKATSASPNVTSRPPSPASSRCTSRGAGTLAPGWRRRARSSGTRGAYSAGACTSQPFRRPDVFLARLAGHEAKAARLPVRALDAPKAQLRRLGAGRFGQHGLEAAQGADALGPHSVAGPRTGLLPLLAHRGSLFRRWPRGPRKGETRTPGRTVHGSRSSIFARLGENVNTSSTTNGVSRSTWNYPLGPWVLTKVRVRRTYTFGVVGRPGIS
jgi:hypothetical protein